MNAARCPAGTIWKCCKFEKTVTKDARGPVDYEVSGGEIEQPVDELILSANIMLADDHDGNQTALFSYNDPGQLPITPVRNAEGEWVRLKVRVVGPTLWLRAWEARVGRVKLYLLDSNDPANSPVNRGVTSELYGGGKELRLQQEMVLGLGGWRLLHAVGLKPEVLSSE